MERLFEILGVLAVLYVMYKLTLGKWDYTSPHKRQERKNELKKEGLSVRFYFMHPRTQAVLTFFSGGFFTFYWLYKQWKQVLQGFKQLDGTPLKGNAFTRMLGGLWNFYTLAGLINRTCEYMHKPTAWPAWLWEILWLGGITLVFCPVAYGWKIAGYLLWCMAPSVFQKRINSLSNESVSARPRLIEIFVTILGAACVLCLVGVWYLWTK